MLGLKRGVVQLAAHDDDWSSAAAQTIQDLFRILGAAAVDIQHVGSTSVRGIEAKPIIDIAVAVRAFEDVSPCLQALKANGFVCRHHAVDGDMLFVRGDFVADTRTHHIHVVIADGREWTDYIHFRDYLNAHTDAAKAYEALKQNLARAYPFDRDAYTQGKAEFIAGVLRKAASWAMLGRTVTVTIDRPLGSTHPRKPDIFYTINYGYVKGVIGGDGAAQDAYVLGVNEPVRTFTGEVVAVVYRADDNEDKWIVAPVGARYTREEVARSINFVEQYFDTSIECLCGEGER